MRHYLAKGPEIGCLGNDPNLVNKTHWKWKTCQEFKLVWMHCIARVRWTEVFKMAESDIVDETSLQQHDELIFELWQV
jgi:hypothetical protein